MGIMGRGALLALALLWLGEAAAVESHAVVFLYNRFGEGRYPQLNIRTEQFEAQLRWIETNGYQVWPLEQIVRYLQEGREIPDKTIALTADDAYLSIYREAFPRLKARGWPMTIFVSTLPVDQGLPNYISWEQMREMAEQGIRFANHGASHTYLLDRKPGESESDWLSRVREDIQRGQRRLQEKLGPETNSNPPLFAYPYGEFDATLAALIKEMGFVAFAQYSGPIGPASDLGALPRYRIAEGSAGVREFAVKASSLPLPVKGVEPQRHRSDRNPPKLTVSLEPIEADLTRLTCFAEGKPAKVEWQEQGERFTVEATGPLPSGRVRYTCTVPHEDGRYFWFTRPLIVR